MCHSKNHSAFTVFGYRFGACLATLVLVVIPMFGLAQQAHDVESEMAFFETRALQDAAYEHSLTWQSEEDEIDFWTDQRNFETQLRESYLQGYQIYLLNKRVSYLDHQTDCKPEHSHGDYYLLQSAFYLQSGPVSSTPANYLATSSAH